MRWFGQLEKSAAGTQKLNRDSASSVCREVEEVNFNRAFAGRRLSNQHAIVLGVLGVLLLSLDAVLIPKGFGESLLPRGTKWEAGDLNVGALPFRRAALSAAQDSIGKQDSNDEQASNEAELKKIRELVHKLGDDEFDEREFAKEQLLKMGVVAFDALYEARNDRDLEVRLAAQRLIQDIQIPWLQPNDSQEVERLLAAFDEQSVSERRSRIEQLAKRAKPLECMGLVRVARFDPAEQISKEAAVKLMFRLLEEEPQVQKQLADKIKQDVNRSPRQANRWLSAFASSLIEEQVSSANWNRLLEEETFRLKVQLELSDRDRKTMRDLVYCYSDLLFQFDQVDEGQAALSCALPYLSESQDAVLEAVDRFTERQAWVVINELIAEHHSLFESDPLLLYHVAEVRRQLGDEKAAERFANLADEQLGQDGRARLEVAMHLRERGFANWSERELKKAIELTPVGAIPDVDARLLLCDSWMSLERPWEAAELLAALNEKIADSEEARREISRKHHPPTLVALEKFYRAKALLLQNQSDQAWETLLEAHRSDPNHTDTLIELYRLSEDDSERRAVVQVELDQAVGWYLDRSRQFEAGLGEFDDGGSRQAAADILGAISNKLAWLLINCDGETDEALKYSQRAVELSPDQAAYFDTLALCQWKAGRRELAIQSQQKAVKLAPYEKRFQTRLEDLKTSR